MPSSTQTTRPRMSDEAVNAKTGKTWKDWFAILDKAGAPAMSHQEIVKYLQTKENLGPWWQQMVTVTYEQARGLRKKHQKASGYEINVSRTIKAPLAKLFKSVANDKARLAWLPEKGLTIQLTTPNKPIRADWIDGKSRIEFAFFSKGEEKTQVVVTHRKIPNARSSTRMKLYWGDALDRLRAFVER